MVSKKEKLKYKVVLGHRYVAQIKEVLVEKNVTDASGKFYSGGMIRQVFNGFSENLEIELAIMEAVQRKLKIEKELQKRKDKLISATK